MLFSYENIQLSAEMFFMYNKIMFSETKTAWTVVIKFIPVVNSNVYHILFAFNVNVPFKV